MSIFIASAILLTIGTAYAVMLKRKLAETFFLAVVTVIAIIYCSGLLNYKGSLLIGIYGVVLLAVLSAIYCIRNIIKNKRILHDIEFVQGLVLFGLVMAFALYAGYNHYWTDGDEFSYWGIAVKHMYLFDAFTTSFAAIGPITLPMYFPGASILHYFFTRFGTGFIEYPAYVSMNILFFSTLLPLVKNLFTKKGFLNSLLLIVMFVMIPLQWVYFSPYVTLTIDYLMANLFGVALVYYFHYRYEESAHGVLMVAGAVFLLAVMKDTGIMFALTVCGIIFLDTILFKRGKVKISFQGASAIKRVKKGAFYALPLLLTTFAVLSWKLHLSINNIAPYYSPLTLTDVIAFYKGNIDQVQWDAVKYCYNAILQPVSPLGYSILSFTIVFIIASIIFAIYRKKYIGVRRIIVCVSAIVACAVLYEMALMLTYVFSFYRTYGTIAIHLPSFTRYTVSYFFGIQIFMLTFFIPTASNILMKKRTLIEHISFWKTKLSSGEAAIYKDKALWLKAIQLSLAAILSTYVIITTLPKFDAEVLRVHETRSHMYTQRSVSVAQRWMTYIKYKVKDPIYIISQDPMGWWRARMIDVGEFYPYARIRTGDSTIAEDVAADLSSWPPPPLKFSPEEWERYILTNSISHLYIDISDESFIKSYGRFFPNGVQDGMLYSVNKDNNGRMSLIPVE